MILGTPLFSRDAYAIVRTDTMILIFGYSPFSGVFWKSEVGIRL
jgi:hypothetical protein